MSMQLDCDRARGALLGLAVGDALGTTLEFSKPQAPAFPQLASGPHRTITGGGPFGVAPGQTTDDTQMACALATSLLERGKLDVDDLAARYVAWGKIAFDAGAQTRAALSAISRSQRSPEEAGRSVWLARNRSPAGNGSLMRTAPIAVFFARDPEARRLAALADSAITHYDFRCQLACAAFDAAIAHALVSDHEPAALADAAAEELTAATRLLLERHPEERREIELGEAALREDLESAHLDDPDLYSPDLSILATQGYVRVAFRLAFWELLHAPSFEAGLVDAVNRGGDADTNGAIAGALLGACHGGSAIPESWSKTVLSALQDGEPGPLRDLYHPKRLLGLIGDERC
jgi:ADP-ribosylglycohydrolase